MENVFSSDSASVIQKAIEVVDETGRRCINDLDFYFDIGPTSEWIKKNQYKKVALQFPDELLNQSVRIAALLRQNCPHSFFFILADTSFGNCCVDFVAAEHYQADSIVHYGPSCLSPVDKLPVLYVFEKFQLDLDLLVLKAQQICKNNKPGQKLIILYDVEYQYLYNSLKTKCQVEPSLYVSALNMSNSSETKTLLARILPHDLTNDADSHKFLYIGNRESFLNPFMFYFNKNAFYSSTSDLIEPVLFSRTNKELMKRYYLIERARDAKIFGILIGTMSVANYNQAVDHVSQILKRASRRYYSFLIGKLNCPKLNNFMEVDMYVLVACSENSLINSKELNKPIITVYELEMAFNEARLWGNEFICDFRQLLPGHENYKPLELSEKESDMSLITGAARYTRTKDELNEINRQTALINRDEALSVIHYDGAGEYLKNRTWTGLEQNLGQDEVKLAGEGRKGIAAQYQSEPDNH